ncbi:MAG: hypothetical protein CME88_07310 [Hirschia sp.]|nr:hypothetical protein [Hirschia sp.]MBF18169.1 hypothetical protein [Hirschia sp.]
MSNIAKAAFALVAMSTTACATTSQQSVPSSHHLVTLEHFTFQEALKLQQEFDALPGYTVEAPTGSSNYYSVNVIGPGDATTIASRALDTLGAMGYPASQVKMVLSADGGILIDKIY